MSHISSASFKHTTCPEDLFIWIRITIESNVIFKAIWCNIRFSCW